MLVIEQAVVQVLCLCRNYVLCASGGVGGTAPGGGRHHLGQVGLVLRAWVPNATATNAAKSWPDFSTGLATIPVFRAKKGPLALRRPFCWKTLATYNKQKRPTRMTNNKMVRTPSQGFLQKIFLLLYLFLVSFSSQNVCFRAELSSNIFFIHILRRTSIVNEQYWTIHRSQNTFVFFLLMLWLFANSRRRTLQSVLLEKENQVRSRWK